MFVFFYIKNNSIFRFFEHQISKQKNLVGVYIYDIFLEQVLDSRVVLGMGIIILLMENTKYISSNIKSSKYYKLLIYMCDISHIMLENICGVFITNITRFTYIYTHMWVTVIYAILRILIMHSVCIHTYIIIYHTHKSPMKMIWWPFHLFEYKHISISIYMCI